MDLVNDILCFTLPDKLPISKVKLFTYGQLYFHLINKTVKNDKEITHIILLKNMADYTF